jgi:hypothetical protein
MALEQPVEPLAVALGEPSTLGEMQGDTIAGSGSSAGAA